MTAGLPRVRLESDLFTGPLVELWDVLFDLVEQVSDAWSLIGGQMVLLHGLEHGRIPPAASADLDVLADVQSDQQSLRRLVAALERLGFSPAGMSPQGNLLHRYQRGVESQRLVVDLLAPDNLGPRADLTTTPPGRTLEVPGGRQAAQRTEAVVVQLGQRTGRIRRPSLLGAIVAKAAAVSIKTAPPERHYRDLAFLLSFLPIRCNSGTNSTRVTVRSSRSRRRCTIHSMPLGANWPTRVPGPTARPCMCSCLRLR